LDGQHLVVSMAEETLQRVQVELGTAAAAADAKRESLEATIVELEKTVKEADAEFAAWSARWRASLDDATAVASNSARIVAERREAQAQGDAHLIALKQDILALEKAFQSHFQKPIRTGKGPNLQELKPFLQKFDIEEPTLLALPGICAKSQTNWSDEEQAIFEQLEMAIAVKISMLTETATAETLANSERAEAVKKAEMDYCSTKQDQDHATLEFEAAMKGRGGGQEALKKGYMAKEAVKELRPQLETVVGLRDSSTAKLSEFKSEDGPLAIFMALKARTSLAASIPIVDGSSSLGDIW